MKICTYYEETHFEQQKPLLELWGMSWERNGYEPIVLSRRNAESHPLFPEFLNTILGAHLKITGKPLNKYGVACWIRWLAYATQNEEGFYMSDYDVFNPGVKLSSGTPKGDLVFLDWHVPCFVYGTPSGARKFCEAVMSSVQREENRFKILFEQHKWRHFHDQEFVVAHKDTPVGNFVVLPHKDRLVELYDCRSVSPSRLVHVAHRAVAETKAAKPEFADIPNDILRLQIAKGLLKNTMKDVADEKENTVLWELPIRGDR